ncbi:MAG: hypothetical protein KAU20_04690, partial [Nanoarchaeota archaeon]|nr:hypothetical protein [Nanoarchaeota archaeon]
MITPKNFIAQMGQDFDIDKLTTYQYYHAKDKDGKIARISEWNKEQALIQYRKALEDLKSKGSLTKKERGDIIAGIDALLSDTTGLGGGISNDFFLDILELEEFDIEEQMRKVAENFDMKLAKNKFIEIHNKVYNSTNSEVQRKINKVLSMEVAEKQAEGIDEINTQNSTAGVNLYSPNYQMNKLISGSTGNTAIGIYAKGVTFNSLVQQSDVPLNLIKQGKEGKSISKEVRIGNIVSKGTFGLTTTISKTTANEIEKQLARTITEAMDEKVNTATDNEKAQILGRVGITHIDSVAVDNLLSLLGVDLEINTISEKEYDPNNKFHKKAIIDGKPVWYSQYSIPYLLHSQPIIKEYFRQLKDSKSIINEFDVEAEDKIIKSLIGDYKTTAKTYEAAQSKMTGELLVGNIKSGILNDDVQREILLLYTDLIKDAKKVKELNQIVDLSNLGKSMWELKDKIEKLQDLQNPDGTFNEMFDNPLSLLGAMEQGNFVAKTNQGVMVSNALELGRNLFFEKGANLYPYYDEYLEEVVTSIVKNSNFSGKEVDFKETIFQEIKKYITTNSKDNIFTTNPTIARNEIFFSRDGKESLSKYMAKIFNAEDSSPLVKQNVLLSALSYTVGNNGKPDIIKFDNTEGANVTEEDFYIAFKELLVNDIALPDRNGKPYTTKKMAQELIAYSHLSGGIVSGAIEFHKFIPIEYYEDLRVDAKTKSGKTVNVSTLKMLQRYDTKINNWRTSGVLDTFEVQFFQNNPGNAVQFDKKFSNKHLAFESNSMSINV